MDLQDYSNNLWRIYRLFFFALLYYRYVAATSWIMLETKLFYFFKKSLTAGFEPLTPDHL